MSRKNFEVPDHGLWDEVKRAIQPLSLRMQLKAKPKIAGVILQRHAAAEPIIIRKQLRNEPPAISSFDRRTTQKLGRGNAEPEARIDLHGENLETARLQLMHFVSAQRHRGVADVESLG